MREGQLISKMNPQGFADVRLDTWKSIAQYIGRSTRTAQRWRSEYGLPVRHLGGDATSVFAYTDELDGWLRSRDQSQPEADLNWQESSRLQADLLPAAQLSKPDVPSRTSGQSGRRAVELVILAQRMWRSLSESNLSSIARIFREAADLDPSNAKAFAGLSQALIAEGVLGCLHTSDVYRSAEAALERALELDPNLIETQCSAAWLKLLVVRDWNGARIGFDEVLVKRPDFTQAIVGRALLNLAEGQFARASELLREASVQSPLDASATALLCWGEYLAGNFESALAFVSQARASGHAGAVFDAVEALANVLLKGPAENIERLTLLLKDSPRHYAQLGVLGYAQGTVGQAEKAQEIIESMSVLEIRGKSDYAYSTALTYLGLNERRVAMESLEKSYLQGSLWSLGFQSDPILAPLRDDPQTSEWFRRMGSPIPGIHYVHRPSPIQIPRSSVITEIR
jgi:tetratricopeptide (TPR) repeat protein